MSKKDKQLGVWDELASQYLQAGRRERRGMERHWRKRGIAYDVLRAEVQRVHAATVRRVRA